VTTDRQASLFDADPEPPASPVPSGRPSRDAPDAASRAAAADPRQNVVLEASAGTGKTSVLVGRYLNLLRAGVDPANILAITFTRRAAAEMRQRIVDELRSAAAGSEDARRRWLSLRERLGELSISTIDAFCYALLREFPLEADVDPGVEMADETEVARLGDEAIDHALSIGAALRTSSPELTLLFTELATPRLRVGLAYLLAHRLEAPAAVERFLRTAGPVDADGALAEAFDRIVAIFRTVEGGIEGFLQSGPLGHPRFRLFSTDLRRLMSAAPRSEALMRSVLEEARRYFLTRAGVPRQRLSDFRSGHWRDETLRRRHGRSVREMAPAVRDAMTRLDERVNHVLVAGLSRLGAITVSRYRQRLAERGLVDFPEALARAVSLLERMEEFSQSRFRLEARYHHLLIDEFQDTSWPQWQLISLLIDSWGEGAGLVAEGPLAPSIFVVGDRKQSIYGFRDADPAILGTAGRRIAALRQEATVRQAIATSFRSVPALLAFVNDVFDAVPKEPRHGEGFTFGPADRFASTPVERAIAGDRALATADPAHEPVLGLVAAGDADEAARAVAQEIGRLVGTAVVRDRVTGVHRPVEPADIAVLFRSRESHREFEQAITASGVQTYVYKGLGFFDTDEVKDLSGLVRFLARPASSLRAAAFLRSRFVRVSDQTIRRLAPDLAGALTGAASPPAEAVDPEDRDVLEAARRSVRRWLAVVDCLPPAELIDRILSETAYAFELAGSHRAQARENVKKFREIVRRIQNAGYASLDRLAAHVDRLSTGDESNATLDAARAVHLMTIHAAKGLEFPIVFLVNLGRGSSAVPSPLRVVSGRGEREPLVAVAGALARADDEERWREREETKRLLYVAMTRARDRLYLSSLLKDGAIRHPRGSLVDVLPEGLRILFETVWASNPEEVQWHGPSGRVHRLRVCQDAPSGGSAPGAERLGARGPVVAGDPIPFDRSGALAAGPHAREWSVGDPDDGRARGRWALQRAFADPALRRLVGAGRAATAVTFVARLPLPDDADRPRAAPVETVRGTFDLVIDLPDRVVIGSLADADRSNERERLVTAARSVFPGRRIESVLLE